MPAHIKVFTQGIAGVFIGIQTKPEQIKDAKRLVKPLLLLLSLFTLNTFITGIILSKVVGIDLITALLSCVSGGVTDISILSMELGADTSTVAILQTSRLVTTLAFFPSWIAFSTRNDQYSEGGDEKKKSDKQSNEKNYGKLLFTISVAFLASFLGRLSNIPAGSLIFSITTISILNNFTNLIYTERKIKLVSQLFAGSLIGTTITYNTFINIPKLILPILILISSYWILNFVFGYICNTLKWMDRKTALFASCPAGASDMALIASEIGADLSKVGTFQIVRLLYSIAIMPQLIMLFLRLMSFV